MSSKDITSSTSRSTALVPPPPLKRLIMTNVVFIRPLRPEDARAIFELQNEEEEKGEVDFEEKAHFGIFNLSYKLIGLYETIEEAFNDSKGTTYQLLRFQ